MRQSSARDKLNLILAVLCVLDVLLGIVLVYRLVLARMPQGDEILVDVQITVDSWTMSRPFVFALILGAMFLSRKLSEGAAKVITGIGFGIGLLYYIVLLKWFDVVALYKNYQIAELNKPFILDFLGWSEWDMIRGILLIALFVWWSYQLFNNSRRIDLAHS